MNGIYVELLKIAWIRQLNRKSVLLMLSEGYRCCFHNGHVLIRGPGGRSRIDDVLAKQTADHGDGPGAF